MSSQRIFEYDIYAASGVANTNNGNGPTIDLWRENATTNRYSLHYDWTVNTFTNRTFTDLEVNTTNDTITITSHGYETGLAITLTTAGTLPSPLLIATTYYIIAVDADTIKLSTSKANSFAGTAIDLTTTGAGTSTVNVSALSGGSCTYQTSGNGVLFANITTGINVTATGGSFITQSSAPYRYIRVTKNITNGSYSLRVYLLCIGELS